MEFFCIFVETKTINMKLIPLLSDSKPIIKNVHATQKPNCPFEDYMNENNIEFETKMVKFRGINVKLRTIKSK